MIIRQKNEYTPVYVTIKYDPYQVKTEVTIEGKPVQMNSKFNVCDAFLQEWIEDFPYILSAECDSRWFDVTFIGEEVDYEDALWSVKKAKKYLEEKGIRIDMSYTSGKFEEKRSEESLRVNIIGGTNVEKANLLNALLGHKLIPPVKDNHDGPIVEVRNTNLEQPVAKAYNVLGKTVEISKNPTYEMIENMTRNSLISLIKIEMSISFAGQADITLVYVPTVNGIGNLKHKTLLKHLINKARDEAIIFMMNASTELMTETERYILRRIADEAIVDVCRARERIIIIVDEMERINEQGKEIEAVLGEIKVLMRDLSVSELNLFPVSTKVALGVKNGRFDLGNGCLKDENKIFELKKKTRLLLTHQGYHLENYSDLPKIVNAGIIARLRKATKEERIADQVLIHTGLISIEEAIKMYYQKYMIRYRQIDNQDEC